MLGSYLQLKPVSLRGLGGWWDDYKTGAAYEYDKIGSTDTWEDADEFDLKSALKSRFQHEYTNISSLLAQFVARIQGISDPVLKQSMLDRANFLRSELEIYSTSHHQFTGMPDNLIRLEVSDFHVIRDQIKNWRNANESVFAALPGLQIDAERAAEAARAALTPEAIAEIEMKSGGMMNDELYMAQLKQQLFMQALAEEYEKELGPEVMEGVNNTIEENAEMLERARPTQAIVGEAFTKAVDAAEKGTRTLRSTLKWASIAGITGIVIYGLVKFNVIARVTGVNKLLKGKK